MNHFRASALLFVLLAAFVSRSDAAQPAPVLRAGNAALRFPRVKGGFGLHLALRDGKDAPDFGQRAPLQLEVVNAQGEAAWLRTSYTAVTRDGAGFAATGSVRSANGSRFVFRDRFRAANGAFSMARNVEVQTPDARDAGFATRFELPCARPLPMERCDFFVPGVWYRHNAGAPPRALASRLTDRDYFFREDRLPLPLVMLRDRASGVALSLLHQNGVPSSFAGEDGRARLIDARMQFGAPGIINHETAGAAFNFPGSESERTYVGGASPEGGTWALRSHPVRAGVAHRYTLRLQLSRTPGFAAALRQSWRTAYAAYAPPVVPADLEKVYRDGMELMNGVCREYHGVVGLPFLLSMPTGELPANDNGAVSGQMGFVGQQIPACALLLRYGFETRNDDLIRRASSIVDFWATAARTPAGVLRTWYDIQPNGSRTWRDYPMFLRVASDGVDGALQAWNAMHQHGQERPQWLRFARDYGDWLVANQNPDGSYFRAYGFDGAPLQRTTDTTDHPVRFLVDLFRATGEAKYRAAALRAGEFCLRTVHEAYSYVGGTPDNPNALDKEGGVMALDAFLALHDATGERRWLDAAAQAADFVETWTYCWNIPIAPGDPQNDFPPGRTTHGLSLIATGHSGADNFMAREAFDFYRLSLLTRDAHRRDFARFILFDTKQLLDWDGTLGYAQPGLQLEAMSLAVKRGHSVKTWLPWLSVATIEPLAHLQDTFGAKNIDSIEAAPRPQLLAADAKWAATRGFAAPR